MSAAQDTAVVAPVRRHSVTLGLSATGCVAALVVIALLVLAVIGPMLAPYPPGAIVTDDLFGPMSRAHLFGTDYLGRDMLSRILESARYTLGIALPAAALASLTGTSLGMLAASAGGLTDAALSRAMDTLICFPSIIFSLVVVAACGSSVTVLILTAGVIYTPGCFRIVRSIATDISAKDFVHAARARGERSPAIVVEEILPNMVAPILTDFGLRFVFIVLLLSSLSFLGLGIQPPYSDWGGLVHENLDGLSSGAPAVLIPAICIAVLTVSINLLIDSLPSRKGARRG